MDKFLAKHNLPRLNQEKKENINRPIISTEIESVINKNSQQIKVQDQAASQGYSIKYIKKSQYLSFSNYSKKLMRREHSQIHSMKPPLP